MAEYRVVVIVINNAGCKTGRGAKIGKSRNRSFSCTPNPLNKPNGCFINFQSQDPWTIRIAANVFSTVILRACYNKTRLCTHVISCPG